MLNQFSRTQLLYGRDAMNYFASCRIAMFDIGGVGGYVVEALARSGIGAMDLIDDDRICLTMIDRAEQFLIEHGFFEERVRMHGNIARIEVPPVDIPRLAADGVREEIYEEFREIGFLFVTLDLKGYRLGSMNATLQQNN